ncbi:MULTISPECIES: TIGR04222 domain-containing membrane protein [unclassified Crossiella]|uniref:TIGR04222 domain-containing membrane protein n=1 Tax=unclassified Crossiella TaxID=2620835 RepID=UPI001FFE7003|nr:MULTISPECIES: TIGR04222 domain-containing membrane protein [unclassified Crossiella]MCK2240459.1 TIGR04222 domain-containing membrane protein [Crossiella sp. S99.2]MCK2253090.1 TIGR04222 domain-containing membrane protein [Crossiella sp. S99.1]
MTETWGLTGPQFLLLYGMGLLVSIVVAVWARRSVRRAEAAPGAGRLSADDVAYLAGGGDQVVFTAVARMLEAGSLRASRGSWLSVTGLAAQHPLDRVILAELNARTSPAATLGSLRAKYADHPLVGQVRNRLETLGLVVPRRRQALARLRGAAAFGLLLLIGVARVVDGVGNGRPIGYLAGLLGLTAPVALVLLITKMNRLTLAGEQTLNHFRTNVFRKPAADDHDQLALIGGAAMLVALGGLAAFPDETVSRVLALPSSGGGSSGGSSCSGSSSSSSSSSSCSSSSGDSGGGGGGGGCGG